MGAEFREQGAGLHVCFPGHFVQVTLRVEAIPGHIFQLFPGHASHAKLRNEVLLDCFM